MAPALLEAQQPQGDVERERLSWLQPWWHYVPGWQILPALSVLSALGKCWFWCSGENVQCCQAKPLPGYPSPSLAKPFLECLGKANHLVVSESKAQNIFVPLSQHYGCCWTIWVGEDTGLLSAQLLPRDLAFRDARGDLAGFRFLIPSLGASVQEHPSSLPFFCRALMTSSLPSLLWK